MSFTKWNIRMNNFGPWTRNQEPGLDPIDHNLVLSIFWYKTFDETWVYNCTMDNCEAFKRQSRNLAFMAFIFKLTVSGAGENYKSNYERYISFIIIWMCHQLIRWSHNISEWWYSRIFTNQYFNQSVWDINTQQSQKCDSDAIRRLIKLKLEY